ncbi:EF-P 5-aminopentanol modification-associated protein YfmF [Bacillus salitolerans]|uniref:EF-P 5-aminopentanol modification-associated protein YfmF n=1 Tax=Bacillus salitolerans TaxID=1437434 RepID=A0ABW4LMZ0_9BACI
MKVDQEIVETINGMTLHTIETKKYKTNTFVLKLKAPLTKEDVTKRALLPYVLQSATSSYPSTSKLRSYLDELYGASLNVDLSKKGEYHIITIRIEIANETYLTDQTPLLEKGLNLLAEIILNPLRINQAFESSIVEKEKRSLIQRIQAVYDDKMRYANLRLVEEMCKNEPYSLHVNGEKEDVASITPELLYEYYQKAIKEDEIDLYIVGDVDSNTIRNLASRLFTIENRHPTFITESNVRVVKEKEVIEQQDVKQGKLNIGYRTNTKYQDQEYPALQVFNGIFGGFSHSKLFINVREKASLAYYAASRVESHKGLLMVMSGVDAKNYHQAVTIINEQMKAMENGDFSDQEIEQTKAVLINQILEAIDTPRGLVEILYNEVVGKVKESIESSLTRIGQVTRNEIVHVANKIELDTIYFLKGKEEV